MGRLIRWLFNKGLESHDVAGLFLLVSLAAGLAVVGFWDRQAWAVLLLLLALGGGIGGLAWVMLRVYRR